MRILLLNQMPCHEYSYFLYLDILMSRRGRLITCSSGNHVRLWSVVNVGEMKLGISQHQQQQNKSGNSDGISAGVTLEDEMTLDGPIASASFDDTLDMVMN